MIPTHRPFCLLLAAGAALALAVPPARADVLHSPQGYTVTVPHGWQTRHETVSHAGESGTDMMYTHPPGRLPVFRIEVDPQGAASMKNAPAMQAAFVQSRIPGARVLQQRRRPLAGSPASETAAAATFQGRPVVMDMIFTIHNGRSYTISLMTTPQTLKSDFKTFAGILATLHWAKPAA